MSRLLVDVPGAFLILMAAASPPALARAVPGEEMVSVIHLHSDRSDGHGSPAELARAAREADIDAIVLADHFLARVAYAPWPLGQILGFGVSAPSVSGTEIDRYLRGVARADRGTEGLLLLPGLEVAPHARWTGSLLARSLELRGWHRHLLLLGVDEADALSRLPVSGNRAGGVYGPWSSAYLIPAAVLVWAALRLHAIRSGEPVSGARTRIGRRATPPILAGGLSLFVLLAGFPYRVERFSPLDGDPGAAPFREVARFVRPLGGLAILAHPESASAGTAAFGVRLRTEPSPWLLEHGDLDGFAALPEGTETIIPPGGVWDRTLIGYLSGTRPAPPWAIAENDEHNPPSRIDFGLLQTVLWTDVRNRDGFLEALRRGRHYARWTPAGSPPLRLRAWSASASGRTAYSGDTLISAGEVVVRAAVDGGDRLPVQARLIRNGRVIRSLEGPPPLEIELREDPRADAFYRLDVEGAYPRRLLSNPIFVRRGGNRS